MRGGRRARPTVATAALALALAAAACAETVAPTGSAPLAVTGGTSPGGAGAASTLPTTAVPASTSPGVGSGPSTPSATAALAAFQAFIDDAGHTYRATMRSSSSAAGGSDTVSRITVAGSAIDLELIAGGSSLHLRSVEGHGYAETPAGWRESPIVLPTVDLAGRPWWYLGRVADLRPVSVEAGNDTFSYRAPAPYPISAVVLGTEMPATTVTAATLVLRPDGHPVSFTVTGTNPDGSTFGTVTLLFSDVGAPITVEAPIPLAS
jgi:hypothetical protein